MGVADSNLQAIHNTNDYRLSFYAGVSAYNLRAIHNVALVDALLPTVLVHVICEPFTTT